MSFIMEEFLGNLIDSTMNIISYNLVEIQSRTDSPNTTTESSTSSTSSNSTSVRLGKELELLMEALNCLETPEQRIAALCKKVTYYES